MTVCHQAWINIDFIIKGVQDIHLRVIVQNVPMSLVHSMSLEITQHLISQWPMCLKNDELIQWNLSWRWGSNSGIGGSGVLFIVKPW